MKDVLSILFTMLLAVTLVACDSSDDGDDDDSDTPTTQVRFVHASPDAGPVDVFVNDTEVAGDFAFTSTEDQPVPNTSSYLDIEVGTDAVIEVRNQEGNVVNSLNVDGANLQEDARYTVVVAGAVSANGPEAVLLRDRFEDIPSDAIGLRLVHGSARAQAAFGPVDIYVQPPGTSLSTVDPLLSGFEFTENSGSILLSSSGAFAPQPLSGETQIVSVTAEGDTTAALEVPIGGDNGFPLQAGQYVTGIAADVSWGQTGVGALVLAEDSP